MNENWACIFDNPLLNILISQGWRINPLMVLPTRVQGTIHHTFVQHQINTKLLKIKNKKADGTNNKTYIKCLTYLIINKEKYLKNKQIPITPPYPKHNSYSTQYPYHTHHTHQMIFKLQCSRLEQPTYQQARITPMLISYVGAYDHR